MYIFYVIVLTYFFIDNVLTRKKYVKQIKEFRNDVITARDVCNKLIDEYKKNNMDKIQVHKKHLIGMVGLLEKLEKDYPTHKEIMDNLSDSMRETIAQLEMAEIINNKPIKEEIK